MKRFALTLVAIVGVASPAWAGPGSKAAQEVAEFLFKKGSREAVEHGVQAFARKIEASAVRHGDDVFAAVKNVGGKALPMIETHGSRGAKILGKHGERGALILERPSAMKLVTKHGDDAVEALAKHPGGVAEKLIEQTGSSAIKAFTSVGPQGGRRLAMLADDAPKLATDPKLLDVIARYGDSAMGFVWKNKTALLVSAALVAFVSDPEPFLNGTRDLTKIVAENAIKPLAEVPGKAIEGAAQHAMPEVAKKTNWTVVILLGMALLAALVGWFLMRRSP